MALVVKESVSQFGVAAINYFALTHQHEIVEKVEDSCLWLVDGANNCALSRNTKLFQGLDKR